MKKSIGPGITRTIDDPVSLAPASLESVLCTNELRRRPRRPPNYQTENAALVTLSNVLADSPREVLQTLADTILEVCDSGSAGISLLTTEDGGKQFNWPAIAGQWKPHIGGIRREISALAATCSIAIPRCYLRSSQGVTPTSSPFWSRSIRDGRARKSRNSLASQQCQARKPRRAIRRCWITTPSAHLCPGLDRQSTA